MGCGCLGPPKNKDEVYVNLIKQIHGEACKVSSNEQLDMYKNIKQRLSKKGYLRKLIDNLGSHRTRIPDSISYNLRLVMQKKQLPNSYAGLIIADFVINGIYEETHQENKDLQILSQFERKSSMSQHLKDSTSSTYKTKPNRNDSSLSGAAWHELQTRFDVSYFNLLTYLLSNQMRMYHRVISSIQNCCRRKEHKFLCDNLVWKVLRTILEELQKGVLVAEGTETFHLLLHQTKEQMHSDFKDSDVLSRILHLWFKSLKQAQKQSNIDENTLKIQQNYEQIIRIYFHRAISCWQAEFVYEVLFSMFDSLAFDKTELEQIEKMLQHIMNGHDLKQHFFRGLFTCLLSYLCLSQDEWIDFSGFKLNRIKEKFKNRSQETARVNSFRTLIRWTLQRYVDIDDTVMYNWKPLLSSFVINLTQYKGRREAWGKILEQYTIYISKISKENKQNLIFHLCEELRGDSVNNWQIETVIKLLKQSLRAVQIITNNVRHLVLKLEKSEPMQIKLQMLKVMSTLMELYSDNIELENKEELCEFLFSVFTNLVSSETDILDKHQFLCASISYLRVLMVKVDKSLLVAYLFVLDQECTRLMDKLTKENFYWVLSLMFQCRYIVFKGLKIPQKLLKLNYKINKEMKVEIVKSEMQQYVLEADPIEIEKVMQSSVLNKGLFKEYKHGLQKFFVQNSESQMLIRSSEKAFERMHSIYDENSEDAQDSKSLEEVLSIINN